MLEILQFVFSDIWIWLGTVAMLYIISEGLSGIFAVRVRHLGNAREERRTCCCGCSCHEANRHKSKSQHPQKKQEDQ